MSLSQKHNSPFDSSSNLEVANGWTSTQEAQAQTTQEGICGLWRQEEDIQQSGCSIRNTSTRIGRALGSTAGYLRPPCSSPNIRCRALPPTTPLTSDPTDGPFIIEMLEGDFTQPKLVRQQNTAYYSNDEILIFIGE